MLFWGYSMSVCFLSISQRFINCYPPRGHMHVKSMVCSRIVPAPVNINPSMKIDTRAKVQ